MGFKKNVINSKSSELTVLKPDNELFRMYVDFIESSFTSESLSDIIATFKPLYYGKRVYELDEETGEKKLSSIVSRLQSGKTPLKSDKVMFLALFFSKTENLGLYCDSLPERIRELWKAVYDMGFIPVEEAEEILGYNIMVDTGYYRHMKKHPDLVLFNLVKGKTGVMGRFNYPESGFFLSVPYGLYNIFYYFFRNEEALFMTDRNWTPSDGENLHVFRGEAAFVREFPLMMGLQEQKMLYIGDSKKMQLSMLRKAALQIGTSEFFPDIKETEVARFRSVLLLNMFTSFMESNPGKVYEEPHILVSELVKQLFSRYTVMVACMFPHISGFKYSCIYDSYLETININILGFFQSISEERWYDVEEIMDAVAFATQGRSLEVFRAYALDKQNLVNRRKGQLLGNQHLLEHLSKPFIKAYVLMLSSLGLLDVAYRDYSDNDISYVDWVKYCRLTNLGKYVFGHTKEYEPEEIIEGRKYFELESDRLIIKSLDKGNSYEKLLVDISEYIGNGRYKVSYGSFLRNCNTMKEVNSKIDFFRKFVSDEWSELWKNFFDSLGMRCHPLRSVSPEDYLMYKLSPENKELVQVILSDKTISSYIVKAEGYMILIPKSNKKKVFDRLKELGFLV